MKKYYCIFFGLLMPLLTASESNHSKKSKVVYTSTLEEITVKATRLPNLDTLANYILTQSKVDTIDINCMVQVMLNRYYKSNFRYISDMLYSDGIWGSHTVKSQISNYWFSESGQKYLPTVQKEIHKVLAGNTYEDMSKVLYFSNYSCTYHTSNPNYKLVFKSNKHRYFKEQK